MPGAASTGAYCVVREHRMRSGNAADGRSWTGVRAAAGAAEQDAQLVLSSLQTSTLVLRELSAGAIDVEGEHRHGGTERRRLPPAAALGGAFEGTRNLARVIQGKHAWFEIQGLAGLGDPREIKRAGFQNGQGGTVANNLKGTPGAERREPTVFRAECKPS